MAAPAAKWKVLLEVHLSEPARGRVNRNRARQQTVTTVLMAGIRWPWSSSQRLILRVPQRG